MSKVDKELVWDDLARRYDVSFVNAFLEKGAKVYLFGGAPRDIVMKRKWKDADFCVCIPLPPKEKDAKAESIFKEADIAIQSKTDLGHGKMVYRFKDSQSGELVDVRVVQDVWAGGTDFTVNALRLDLETGEILDRFNSVSDIQAKVLRTAVPPGEVFEENPFMTFRAVKAACQLGFELDDSVRKAMKDFVGKVDICVDIIVKNENDFAEWVLSNMLAGLKANPYLYYSLLEEAGSLKVLQANLSQRLNLSASNLAPVNPFIENAPYSYEEAISMFLSALARAINDEGPEAVFEGLIELLGITTPKRGDDFSIDISQIQYRN
ncbi:MAG TPA: hypothetical protein VJA87_00235 [Candidatus Paceibacterota bacterium]